jgi:hypothetical protein
LGELSVTTSSLLSKCHVSVKPRPVDGIVPTKIMCVNKKVDEVNNERLATLPHAEVGQHPTP